ncbi:MAG: DNA topoisomerase IV subunit A [Gammaproteobacteria bacterium]|nr:DNA topoisomerase IV subunit A [Gammaproteobacteria bacterium]
MNFDKASGKIQSDVQPLKDFVEKSYLNYSMYVILDRALPFIGDGLKPVQRRMIYAMSELGLSAQSKPKKSARTVGDVLGKYHPHGDSACYEAMVSMAQDFSYRYPMIIGQGNWGSYDDPKSFAAMRYTEAKLSAYTKMMLSELGQGTVGWKLNFDGTLKEPQYLPARLPNLILNGVTGIAVGMSTDIPPHNIKEIAYLLSKIIKNPEISIGQLVRLGKNFQGPDFPSGGEMISSEEEIKNIYKTGNGSLKIRASYKKEKELIIINELPYQISGNKIIEQIASQMKDKKLPLLTDINDESDHKTPIRIVLTPKSSRVNTDELMSHLFATTDLEKNIRVNMNVIDLDGKPKICDLKQLLSEWIEFRRQTIIKRLEFRLNEVQLRLHILEGLMIIYLNIDEVIRIIREEDKPKEKLIVKFKLSDIQAESILNLRLRNLAKLEEEKITVEKQELEIEEQSLLKLLKSKKKINQLIQDEIDTDVKEYGDDRRTKLNQSAETSQAFDQTQLASSDPVTVILSQSGWVRAAKGSVEEPESLNYKAGDEYLTSVSGRSNQFAVFMDSTGRVYSIVADSLPSARSQGEPLSSRLNPPDGATFAGVMSGAPDTKWLVASSNGYGFFVTLKDLYSKNRKGKVCLKVSNEAKVLIPSNASQAGYPEPAYIAAANSTGKLLIFPANQLMEMSKGKGLKIIGIPTKKFKSGVEALVSVLVLGVNDAIRVYSGKKPKIIRPDDFSNYMSDRGKRGRSVPPFKKIDYLEIEQK